MLQDLFSDSISYAQFKLAVVSMEVETYSLLQEPALKPAIILGATFAVNTILFMNYTGDKTQLVHTTTIIFIVGGALSILTYFVQ